MIREVASDETDSDLPDNSCTDSETICLAQAFHEDSQLPTGADLWSGTDRPLRHLYHCSGVKPSRVRSPTSRGATLNLLGSCGYCLAYLSLRHVPAIAVRYEYHVLGRYMRFVTPCVMGSGPGRPSH